MPLSSTAITSKVSIAFPSLPTSKIVKPCSFPLNNDGNIAHPRATAFMASRSLKFVANSVSGDGSVSVDFDVPFPSDYSELLDQARNATELALKDNRQLMEIEFPTAGLESVPGPLHFPSDYNPIKTQSLAPFLHVPSLTTIVLPLPLTYLINQSP